MRVEIDLLRRVEGSVAATESILCAGRFSTLMAAVTEGSDGSTPVGGIHSRLGAWEPSRVGHEKFPRQHISSVAVSGQRSARAATRQVGAAGAGGGNPGNSPTRWSTLPQDCPSRADVDPGRAPVGRLERPIDERTTILGWYERSAWPVIRSSPPWSDRRPGRGFDCGRPPRPVAAHAGPPAKHRITRLGNGSEHG